MWVGGWKGQGWGWGPRFPPHQPRAPAPPPHPPTPPHTHLADKRTFRSVQRQQPVGAQAVQPAVLPLLHAKRQRNPHAALAAATTAGPQKDLVGNERACAL